MTDVEHRSSEDVADEHGHDEAAADVDLASGDAPPDVSPEVEDREGE